MRRSQQAERRRVLPDPDAPPPSHPAAYAALMDTADYLTGLEICRQEMAERAEAEGAAMPPLALAMQPWGEQSASIGLAEGYVAHLSRTGERPADPDWAAQMAYCTEQFVKRFHAQRGAVVREGEPARIPAPLPARPLAGIGRRGRCTFVAFAVPMASPWPGSPFVGGYLDPCLALDRPDEPDAGILLVTALPDPEAAPGFWPLYRALNRTRALWAEPGADCAAFVDELGRLSRCGEVEPETVLAAARLLAVLARPEPERRAPSWFPRRDLAR